MLIVIVDDNRPETWEIGFDTKVNTLYKNWLIQEASLKQLVINPHWMCLMNREDHNTHLSEEEWKKADKDWDRFLKKHNIRWFIDNRLKGKKVDCEIIRI